MTEPWTARAASIVLGVSAATTALPAGVLLLSGFASPRNWLLFLPVAAVGALLGWSAYGVREGRRREQLTGIALVVVLVVAVDVDALTSARLPLAVSLWSVAGFVALGCLVSPSYRAYVHLVTALGVTALGPAAVRGAGDGPDGPDGRTLSLRRRAGGAPGRGGSTGRTTRP